MSTPPPSEPVDQRTGVQAIVEPIKALGALLGFAIGFLAEHRSGADMTGSVIHGLIGALLLCGIAWMGAVWLVREMMISHVQEQRRLYEARVADALRAQTAREQAAATPLPPAVPRVTLGQGGRS
jgi:hypothetical protein